MFSRSSLLTLNSIDLLLAYMSEPIPQDFKIGVFRSRNGFLYYKFGFPTDFATNTRLRFTGDT